MFDWLDWTFDQLWLVNLVWLAIAVLVGLVVLELHGRGTLDSFLSPAMQRRLTARASKTRSLAQLAVFGLAMIFAIVALMRPQLPGEVEPDTTGSSSADIMFVLDTSRSMLAEDASPNRLARAKAEIAQLVSRLDGDRVGLIAFAGRAAQVCPLTPDHAFFNTVLGTVDTRSAGKGGTKIGDAIRAALRGFHGSGGAKMIVLITDGDDQDPYSQDAATAARDAGVKIVAVGLGSETGSQITLTDPQTGAKKVLTKPDGTPVISKLDGAALRKIALTTEGVYVPAGTSALDLDSIMESHVKPIVAEQQANATKVIPVERYTWMVLLALAAFVAAIWIGAGAGDRRRS